MGEWISIKDRMPEIAVENNKEKYSDNCLVISDQGEIYLGYFITYKYDDSVLFHGMDVREYPVLSEEDEPYLTEYEVTHWMPLPEPPEANNA